MKTLTKAEEQVMQALWRVQKGFLKDIVDAMPNPKPHSNTVATLLKIWVRYITQSEQASGLVNGSAWPAQRGYFLHLTQHMSTNIPPFTSTLGASVKP